MDIWLAKNKYLSHILCSHEDIQPSGNCLWSFGTDFSMQTSHVFSHRATVYDHLEQIFLCKPRMCSAIRQLFMIIWNQFFYANLTCVQPSGNCLWSFGTDISMQTSHVFSHQATVYDHLEQIFLCKPHTPERYMYQEFSSL
jgi:hypothetical protein